MHRNTLITASSLLCLLVAAGCDAPEDDNVVIEHRDLDVEMLPDMGAVDRDEAEPSIDIVVKLSSDHGGFSLVEEDLDPVLVWELDATDCDLTEDGMHTCSFLDMPLGAYSVEFDEVEGMVTPLSHLLVMDEPAMTATVTADYVSTDFVLFPNIEDEEIHGYVVVGLPSEHPLMELGLRNGDIVTEVNGEVLDNYEHARAVSHGEVVVDQLSVVRDHESLEFEIEALH